MVWREKGATMTVRKTKNDVKSVTRQVELAYDVERDDCCMLTYVREYIVEMHGSTEVKAGCTRRGKPADPCKV